LEDIQAGELLQHNTKQLHCAQDTVRQAAALRSCTSMQSNDKCQQLWQMISHCRLLHLQDPLEPFVIFWKRYVISGMGLFTEGYVLFSITNIHVLFQQSYQPCWKT
jgi:hypothetical protein